MASNQRAVGEAILGASDGAFTGLGLVLGLVTGLTASGLLRVALTTAVAGTASMALGELQKDNTYGWRECGAMAVSWLALCLLPVASALIGLGWWLIPAELMGLGVAMTAARDEGVGKVGLLKTYALMVAVAVPTLVVAFVV